VKEPHLISVDELRAAGALDVPASWRKSLAVERDLFTGLFDDADALPDEQQPENAGDQDGDQGAEESADELP
jgi:hypothetical protein